MDPSEGFLATARARIVDPRSTFQVGDARRCRCPTAVFDAVVSGLALNFVPDPGRAAAEFARVAVPGGVAAAYVWDYAEGMAMMRHFWDAAAALDPAAAELDEGRRFPLCRPEPLRDLWTDAGLDDVTVRAIDVPTVFADFDDYWRPFLGGQGPAPGYVMSLTDEPPSRRPRPVAGPAARQTRGGRSRSPPEPGPCGAQLPMNRPGPATCRAPPTVSVCSPRARAGHRPSRVATRTRGAARPGISAGSPSRPRW